MYRKLWFLLATEWRFSNFIPLSNCHQSIFLFSGVEVHCWIGEGWFFWPAGAGGCFASSISSKNRWRNQKSASGNLWSNLTTSNQGCAVSILFFSVRLSAQFFLKLEYTGAIFNQVNLKFKNLVLLKNIYLHLLDSLCKHFPCLQNAFIFTLIWWWNYCKTCLTQKHHTMRQSLSQKRQRIK